MKKLVAALALCAALVGTAVPAAAHSKPYDSTPGMEHDLCVWFRPLSAGFVDYHIRVDGTERRCGVCYSNGSHYDYAIRWFGGWNGPYDIRWNGYC